MTFKIVSHFDEAHNWKMMKTVIFVFIFFLKTLYAQESCPEGLTTKSSNLLVIGRTCFHFVHEDTKREQARDACQSKSGSLAVIQDNTTQTTLFQRGNSFLLSDEVTTRYWIGGRLISDQTISWDDGSQSSFTNLAGNVRYRTSDTSCLLLQLDDGLGKWTTADCNRGLWFYGYICQYRTVKSTRSGTGVDSSSRTGNTASFSSYSISCIFPASLIYWVYAIYYQRGD